MKRLHETIERLVADREADMRKARAQDWADMEKVVDVLLARQREEMEAAFEAVLKETSAAEYERGKADGLEEGFATGYTAREAEASRGVARIGPGRKRTDSQATHDLS